MIYEKLNLSKCWNEELFEEECSESDKDDDDDEEEEDGDEELE